jgi:hypothetical protein
MRVVHTVSQSEEDLGPYSFDGFQLTVGTGEVVAVSTVDKILKQCYTRTKFLPKSSDTFQSKLSDIMKKQVFSLCQETLVEK